MGKLEYVRFQPEPSDRRSVLLEATPLAAARLIAVYRPMGEAVPKRAERYGRERAEAAAKHLSDTARNCDWAAATIAVAQGE